MLARDIGIDLGTANVLIYVKGRGIVLNEPSIVVIETDTKKVIAVGEEANEMLGRTPGKIKAIRPMKDGVIADFELTEIMLDMFIKKIKARNLFARPRILICCPTNITPVEKNAIREAAERMGARKVYIEEEPKVAAIGVGMDISKPTANMVLDIGGGTTDIAVLSLNGIVSSASIKVAGNSLNQDIIRYIREKYKLLIGEPTAEDIKINFANVYKGGKKEKMEVKGRNLLTGLPATIDLTKEETKEALSDGVNRIIKAAKSVLEQTPPELAGDIVEKGVILTGGGAQLNGLADKMEEELTIPVLMAESPLTCVAEGCGMLLNNRKQLEEDQQ
ncbi:MAG: rod shape-determining protein [Bacilli bacterium]|nr:rod shape-determining protein [Bacilli bacterium]